MNSYAKTKPSQLHLVALKLGATALGGSHSSCNMRGSLVAMMYILDTRTYIVHH